MAVLWEQREILKQMRKAQIEDLEKGKDSFKSFDPFFFLKHAEGAYWIAENMVVMNILSEKRCSPHDVAEITRIRKAINSCIKDGFLLESKNKVFDEKASFGDTNGSTEPLLVRTSKRELSINDDKGMELLNPWYFWGKYIAKEFPPLTGIVVTIITTVVTSGAIWFFLLKVIGVQVGR